MADNTTLDPGAGGDTIATDDVGGVKYQRVKLDGGGDGLTEPLPGTTADGLLVNLGANNDVTVTGSVTANAGTNLNTSALALESTLSTLNGKVTAVNTGAVTISAALPAGNNNIGDVDVASMPTVTVQATNLDIRDLSSASDNVAVVGTVADDSTTPGAPVMIGGMAKSPDGTDPGNVSAEDDVARSTTDLNRRIFVNTEHPRWGSFHSDGSTALTDETVAADPGDGFQIVITEIMFSNGADAAINIFFETGSTKILGPWYLSTIGGIGWKGKKHVAASEAVTVTTSASQAQSVDVQYYIQKV